MPVPPTSPQDTQLVVVTVIAVAVGLYVAYWRTALRVTLIVLLALAIYGTIAGVHLLTLLMAAHHQ